MTDQVEALATYGTLAPGEVNHGQVKGLSGRWTTGRVRGHLRKAGWGAAHGFPGITLDPAGPEVTVSLLLSPDLSAHWARLDAFEGAGYRRVPVTVETAEGPVAAQIYALAED